MPGTTFWQWIPSINRELGLVGSGRVIDTATTEEPKRVSSTLLHDATGGSDEAQGIFFIHLGGVRCLCISHGHRVDGETEEADVVILSTMENPDRLADISLKLENGGLLSVRFQSICEDFAGNLDDVAESLFDSIVNMYHTHAHPRGRCRIKPYCGEGRSGALKWICDAYEMCLVTDLSAYRSNPKEPTVYFDIKSCVLYGKSFLEKYGDCLGDGKDDLEYIYRYADATADHTYLSREYRMNHGASENMASMNNRMFILMMLSIAMSFFAGSIFNEAIGGMSRPVWTMAGAVVFVVVGYFGLRYARKMSEKEKDGLYKERSGRNCHRMTFRIGAAGPHIISTRPGIINTWRVQRRPLLRPSS